MEAVEQTADGISSMVPVDRMAAGARKLRDAYARVPGAPLYRCEFGYYCLDEWKKQGLKENITRDEMREIFFYDEPGRYFLQGIGGTTCEFYPYFEEKKLRDAGDGCEIWQDRVGREVLYFKERKSGFMPEYMDHPVKDMKSWDENIKWRLDPVNSERYEKLSAGLEDAKCKAAKGLVIGQYVIGAYMYLRSLIGPEDLLYFFYDQPELIHDCMKTWLELCKAVTSFHQKHLTFDEMYFDEDICYNNGPLISPDMIREFLFPYYQEFISHVRSNQIDKNRHLYLHFDSDGKVDPIIPLYQELGMDIMEPFEVASGNDVVELGRKYPELTMSGGIDKRVLASSKDKIDRMLKYIIPAMRERGGYIPTCDHGVPAEVSLENYMHYRKRCVELGG